MEVIELTETASTNDYAREYLAAHHGWEGAIRTDYQTGGRGSGGSKWESERGKNLLYSIVIHPTWLPVREQYLLSMAQALAVAGTVGGFVGGASVKWPNDIFCGDRKISGTLIETSISDGKLQDVIIGTGINVAQTAFSAELSNPTSMTLLTGKRFSLAKLMDMLLERFWRYCCLLRSGGADEIIAEYHRRLYRNDGNLHPFRDASGEFLARIGRVASDGALHLLRDDGAEGVYGFKEVEHL